MREVEIGTVSWGTMRVQDLIEAFLDELVWLEDEHLDGILEENHNAYMDYLAVQAGHKYLEDLPVNAQEEIAFFCGELFDELVALAPEGVYFGTTEGDGTDFGFWPVEPDEDEGGEDDDGV